MDDETVRGLMEAQQAAVEARQVTDAWQRIEAWLDRYAPGTSAALRRGALVAEVAAVQDRIGVRIPPGLRALWAQHAGVYDVPWASFMLGNWALMDRHRAARPCGSPSPGADGGFRRSARRPAR